MTTLSDHTMLEHGLYALQLAVGATFGFAVVTKLRAPRAFASVIREYQLLPVTLIPWIASGVIALEILTAASFLTGSLLLVVAPVSLVLLLVFAAAVGINLKRGRMVPCGCFGNSEPISTASMARLTFLATAAAGVLVSSLLDLGPGSINDVVSEGRAGLVYEFEIGTLSIFILLIAAWGLRLRELVAVIRGPRSMPATTTQQLR